MRVASLPDEKSCNRDASAALRGFAPARRAASRPTVKQDDTHHCHRRAADVPPSSEPEMGPDGCLVHRDLQPATSNPRSVKSTDSSAARDVRRDALKVVLSRSRQRAASYPRTTAFTAAASFGRVASSPSVIGLTGGRRR
jgi:hypothetical protein